MGSGGAQPPATTMSEAERASTAPRTVVVKVGSSSLTDGSGTIRDQAIGGIADQVAVLRERGHRVLIVSSGAIAAGLPELGLGGDKRPRDSLTLQAASAVGQTNLMRVWKEQFGRHRLVVGQVLLAPFDFWVRRQYLHARGTIGRLLDLGVVPVINENDAIADDEIRFGDNDRIAALVAHLVEADLLVLLTDTPGVFTSDPRRDASASLIDEIVEFDHQIQTQATGSGSGVGSGGMATKLAAARIASWSGVRSVIASADRPAVIVDAVAGAPGVGTVVQPREQRLSRRRLWIAFAVGSSGVVTVDDGARRALVEQGRSLLPAGVRSVSGDFSSGDAVEVAGTDGVVFAKGLVSCAADELRAVAGRRTDQLPEGSRAETIHRDDLVMLPG